MPDPISWLELLNASPMLAIVIFVGYLEFYRRKNSKDDPMPGMVEKMTELLGRMDQRMANLEDVRNTCGVVAHSAALPGKLEEVHTIARETRHNTDKILTKLEAKPAP